MDLLQILSFFLKESNLAGLSPIIELLQNNSFDIAKTLKSLNMDTLAPLIRAFMSGMNNSAKENPTESSVGDIHGLNPIANIADKNIVYTLNKYFA